MEEMKKNECCFLWEDVGIAGLAAPSHSPEARLQQRWASPCQVPQELGSACLNLVILPEKDVCGISQYLTMKIVFFCSQRKNRTDSHS